MHMRRPRGVTLGNSKQLNPQSLPAQSNFFPSLTYSSPPTHCTSLPYSSSLVILPFATTLLSTQSPVSHYSAVSPPCDRPHIPAAGCATHTTYSPTHSYQQAQLKVLRSFILKLVRTNAPSRKARNISLSKSITFRVPRTRQSVRSARETVCALQVTIGGVVGEDGSFDRCEQRKEAAADFGATVLVR